MAKQKAVYKITLEDAFSQGLVKIDKGVDSFEKNVSKATKKSASNFEKLKKKILGLGLAAGAGLLVKNIVSLGVEMEQTRVSFKTFLGSAEKANKAIADLNEFSNVTPFDNAQVIKAGKGLLAFGISQDKLVPVLKNIGDIASGTGKDFNELSIIYGKAKIAGTLMAEDINQLVEAGVPIMGEFAKALGVTEGEVKKMASTGALKFKDLEQAFINLTSEGGTFFNLMEDQSKTVGGRFSTLQGKLQTIGIKIGEALLPVIGAMTDLALMIVENGDALETFAIVVGLGAVALGLYKLAVNASVIATNIYTGAQWLLNAALNANPIGLIIGALAALSAGLIIAWRHSETFRNTLSGVWSAVKQVFSNISTVVTNFPDIVINAFRSIPQAIADTFSGVGDLFSAIFSGDFSSIPNILKKLGGNIIKSTPFGAVATGLFEGLSEGVGDAFQKGVLGRIAKEKAETLSSGEAARSPIASAAAGAKSAGAKTSGKRAGVSSAISGSSPKNVTLNINRGLIETLNINPQNLKEGTVQMTDMVKRALLTALNDVAIVNS